MIEKLSNLKPNPINDEIYSTSDLTDLKLSIKDLGQLEPLCVNKDLLIISGHRRYYAMKQLNLKECEITINEYPNEIIGLISHNKTRAKTPSDIYNEIETLRKEWKKELGQGKRTDLTGEKKMTTKQVIGKYGGVGESTAKQLKRINNYMPELFEQMDKGELSINKANQMVTEMLNKDKPKDEIQRVEFKRRFTKLLKKYTPPLELIHNIVESNYPYSREKSVKTTKTEDKTLSKFDTKREEMINHLDYLKKMDTDGELFYKKHKEIQLYNFKKSLKDKIKSNLWAPTDIQSKMDTIEEVDAIEPQLEIVDGSSEEFNILRVNIHRMPYIVNPGRHIRVIVKDKKSKKYLGCLTLGSDVANLEVRDEYIGWTDTDKFKNKKLSHLFIASSVVPVQPFGYNFLGGKLLASLCTSPQIREYWKEKYGDVLVGCTTTALFGTYSMYNSIPYWKKLGKSKGRFLLHPSIEHYQFWLDYIKDNYRTEYDVAVSRTSPKQHILNLIYKILGIDGKKYENEHERGVYFSMFYKNGNDFLRSEMDEDCLVLKEEYKNGVDGIMEWWKKKAVNRYTKLEGAGTLSDRTYWFDDLSESDVKKYLAVKGLFGE